MNPTKPNKMKNSPETDQEKQESPLVGICSNGMLDALETARSLVHKRRLEAREAGHRYEAQQWCDAETMLAKAIAMERRSASNS